MSAAHGSEAGGAGDAGGGRGDPAAPYGAPPPPGAELHRFLDEGYGPDGARELLARLAAGVDLSSRVGPAGETPLHVAVRRRRLAAARLLLDHGAALDAPNAHGKTAWAHAARRGFDELAELLAARGADTTLTPADRLAVLLSARDLSGARELLAAHPGAARTGNPEEDRLLADVAGRDAREPVALLLDAGAPVDAPGLDGGTPLAIAAWFGQPENARLLLAAGASLESIDPTHDLTPLGWAAHGAGFSGGAAERRADYVAIVRLLLDAGARLRHPRRAGDGYLRELCSYAPDEIVALLRAAWAARTG